MSDFVTLILSNGKTTKYNLKRGLTLLPIGLCKQVAKVHSSSGALMYDIKEQH